jgi:peptidoglycan-associated lipoprotein
MNKLSLFSIAFFIIFSCTSKNDDPTTEVKKEITKAENDSNKIIEKVKISVAKTFTKDDSNIEVDNIYFAFDSFQLSEDAQKSLKPLVKFLKENSQSTITISGHCDSRGTKDYNLILGEKRALAVKNFLKAQNIKADRIETISFGEEKPIKFGEDSYSYKANRRAEITIN